MYIFWEIMVEILLTLKIESRVCYWGLFSSLNTEDIKQSCLLVDWSCLSDFLLLKRYTDIPYHSGNNVDFSMPLINKDQFKKVSNRKGQGRGGGALSSNKDKHFFISIWAPSLTMSLFNVSYAKLSIPYPILAGIGILVALGTNVLFVSSHPYGYGLCDGTIDTINPWALNKCHYTNVSENETTNQRAFKWIVIIMWCINLYV